jgi:hypothetical protein
MNNTVPQSIIDEAMEDDPSAAQAEYGALFRTDVESFVTREIIESCTIPGRHEQPYVSGAVHGAFCDLAGGGGSDSMAVAIGHYDNAAKVAVVDAIREVRPPCSPSATIAEFAQLLQSYRISRIAGDRYAGEWPREEFREHGIEYEPAEKAKSDIYRELLPLLNSRRVELLDSPRLMAQLLNLERRVARGGRDSVDHGPGGHDDLANAAAGLVVRLMGDAQDIGRWLALGKNWSLAGEYPEHPEPPGLLPTETRDGVCAAPGSAEQRRLQARRDVPGVASIVRPGEPMVAAIVPRDTRLATEDVAGNTIVIVIPQGVVSLPRRLMDHWWVRGAGICYADMPESVS